MPRPRPGYRQIAVQVTEDVEARLQELARRTGRTLSEEVTHALTRHMDHPPTVTVDTPPLPPAEIPPPAGKGRRAGRPRKKN